MLQFNMGLLSKIRRWTWELPQSLLGLTLLPFYRKTLISTGEYKDQKIYIYNKFPGGISLGYYILLNGSKEHINCSSECYTGRRLQDSIKHESGHGIQSKWLGPLYLLTVGLCSVGWNILRTISPSLKQKDYYSIWPENQADRLGGVIRK